MKWVHKTAGEIRKWRADTYDKWRERTPEEKAVEAAKLKTWKEKVQQQRAADAERDRAASQPGK